MITITIITMIMTNDHHHHNHHREVNTFLPGVIVGAALMFLLGTPKGREVLRLLYDEGIDRIGEFLKEHQFHETHEHKPHIYKEAEESFEKEFHTNGHKTHHKKPVKVHKE